jgi:hypothetical protein
VIRITSSIEGRVTPHPEMRGTCDERLREEQKTDEV